MAVSRRPNTGGTGAAGTPSIIAYSAISVDTTKYRKPNITSVVSVPTSTFTTQGGAALTIRGHNFGMYTGTGSQGLFSVVGLSRVAYGPSLSSPSVPLFEAVSCTLIGCLEVLIGCYYRLRRCLSLKPSPLRRSDVLASYYTPGIYSLYTTAIHVYTPYIHLTHL